MKRATSKTDIPQQPHFAALEFSSIHIPGDERSRTNPGHGYPDRNEPVVYYVVFENEVEMRAWVARKVQRGDVNFQLINSLPKSYTTETVVTIR